MSRAPRFSRKVEFYTTEMQADAFDALAANGLLNRSDHYRQAFEFYLPQLDALPPTPPRRQAQAMSNGKAQAA
jgi:hypothetical protein